MWKYTFFVSALAVSTCIATGCSDDEDGRPPVTNPVSAEVQASFAEQFPGARDVEWEVRGTYAVADFSYADSLSGGWVSSTAWYNQTDGTWLMSEYDLRFERLPEAVKTAFQQSEYAGWHVDDVDLIRRDGVTLLYVVEVEQGGQEMDLYYAEDGVLVKALADTDGRHDYSDLIPATPTGSVREFIQSRYPGARIVEIDADDGLTEVELIDADHVLREAVFNRSGEWLYTQTEVRRADLPATVTDAWNASEYAAANGYRLDDIDYYETASDGNYYRLELESRYGDVKLKVTPDGDLSLFTPTGGGTVVADAVDEAIQRLCPGAIVVEKDYDDGYLEVEIRHEGREKEMLFNGQNDWVLTRWDVAYRELPEAVLTAFRQSEYAQWELDGITYTQTPTGEWYVLEVEDYRTDTDRYLRITPGGEIAGL